MRTPTLLASIVFASVAMAQPDPADFEPIEVEGDPLYHIEMIVFAYNEANRAEEDFLHGIEDFRMGPRPKLLRLPQIELDSIFALDAAGESAFSEPEPPRTQQPSAITTPVTGNLTATDPTETPVPNEFEAAPAEFEVDALELFELGADRANAAPGDDQALPSEFRTLARDELELSDVRARLNNLRAYRVLGHAGWVLPGVDTDRSVKLDLTRIGITNPVGTIEIYRRRFLHVVVDFDFFDGNGSFWTRPAGFGLAPFEYSQSYTLKGERNAIRSGELHHIDHPLFGALIRITPAPEPEDETGSENAGGPAG